MDIVTAAAPFALLSFAGAVSSAHPLLLLFRLPIFATHPRAEKLKQYASTSFFRFSITTVFRAHISHHRPRTAHQHGPSTSNPASGGGSSAADPGPETHMNGGRFDFDDGGTYCGGWEEGKAHGHGVCTGPDGQGEYAGAWHYGFEVSGLYTWPSGSTYAGQWQNGKRHGLGVEQRGRWVYKGEWTQGYKGRYGRREAINSGAHYLGTWSSGLHDGYGTEVYADGGSYKGQWLRGMRHGYGIRTSAAWGVATKQRHAGSAHTHASLSSLRSGNSNYGSAMLDDEIAAAMDTPNHTGRSHSRDRKEQEQDAIRGGFVLKACAAPQKRRRSLSERSLAMKKTILNNLRIRKQHSTGDIHQRVISAGAASLRSSGSTLSCTSEDDSEQPQQKPRTDGQAQQEEPVDPNTVEVYKGEWKNDLRSGYGVCERSDGLRYAGEWLDNKKHGYGITYFKDGTKEEGRYKHNVLVNSTRRKGGLLFVRASKLRERVEIYAEHARRAADMAAQRVEIATSRTMTAQERAESSVEAAERARDDANTARIYAAQFDPSFKQPGVELMRRQRTGTPAGLSAGMGGGVPLLSPIPNHVYSNHVSFDPSSSSTFPHYPAADTSSSTLHLQQQQHALASQQQQQKVGGWHQRQHALGLQGSSGGSVAPTEQWPGPHSPPQHSADSGIGTGGSVPGYSFQQQQQQRHHLSQQQSSESGQSQPRAEDIPQQQHLENMAVTTNEAIPDTAGLYASTSANYQQPNAINAVSAMHQSAEAAMPMRRPQLRGNIRGRGSPSTMSLSDDHWDQYLLKSRRDAVGMGPSTSFLGQPSLMEAHLRRNRPSLIRQCEVLGASTAGGESPATGLNRRSTLSNTRDRRLGAAGGVPIHSVYGADDSIRHEQQPSQLLEQQPAERGSLPNLDELSSQPLQMHREEAARLASQRRQEAQKQLEEEELLRQNPLRYLLHPRLRNWLIQWKVPILLALGNVLLFYCFLHLLSGNNASKRSGGGSPGGHSEESD